MRFHSTSSRLDPLSLAEVQKKIPEVQAYFQTQPVDLVLLHGSLVRDKMGPLSDVDIAVLFNKKGIKLSEISAISNKLGEILEREDIDLAVLNTASALLKMQVLVHGQIVYASSPKVYPAFRLKTIRHYLATGHLRKTFHRYMENAILPPT